MYESNLYEDKNNYYDTYNTNNQYINDLTFYLILVVIFTPSTIYLLFKRNILSKKFTISDSFKNLSINDHGKLINVIISILLLIINLNLWYYLFTSLQSEGSGGSNSLIKHHLYDQNSFNIKNLPFTKKFDKFNYVKTSIQAYYDYNDQVNPLEEDKGEIAECSPYTIVDHDSLQVASFKQLLFDDGSSVKNRPNGINNEIFELETIRNKITILVSNNLRFPALAITFFDQPKDKSVIQILQERWTKRHTSVIWLDKYQAYYMVSQISYSQSGDKSKSTLSFLYAQVFNKNWQQQFNFKFAHNKEIIYPNILPVRVDHDPRAGIKNIPDSNYGPVEPYVILRHFKKPKSNADEPDEYDEEPIIVYSGKLKDHQFKSVMQLFRPFNPIYNTNNGLVLTVNHHGDADLVNKVERNWIPFFNGIENENEVNDINNLHLNFIYSFNPLSIAKCNIETGGCTINRGGASEVGADDKVDEVAAISDEQIEDVKVPSDVKGIGPEDAKAKDTADSKIGKVINKDTEDTKVVQSNKNVEADVKLNNDNKNLKDIVKPNPKGLSKATPPKQKRENTFTSNIGLDESITKSTQLLPIPKHLLPHNKLTKDKLYWFGIISSKFENCNHCLTEIIRPKVILISYDTKSKQYKLDYISSYNDFNVNPSPWTWTDEKQKMSCQDGLSYVTPNSIVWWNFKNDGTNDQNSIIDYLGLTITESNQNNKFIVLKGWLKHLNKILTVSSKSLPPPILDNDYNDQVLMDCSVQHSNEYCKLAAERYKW
ncbi:hypothetical protein DFJ63DRAFT_331908 [Scheffersomyces coipomensis]|uniref:uncharacterized protein n=1 Tax=Scheffersomyces coipomensis TaxID=1788519 RepID=UPI00315D5161